MLATVDIFVGAAQRADGKAGGSWPEAYVTLKLGNVDRSNMSPATARHVARQLKRFADAIDPPTPRKRRATV